MTTRPDFVLRDATEADVPNVLRLARGLAEYEKLQHEFVATESDFHAALFGPQPQVHAVMADLRGHTIAMALWFYNFSSFLGRPGIYVEDVFVEPAHRHRGVVGALFRHLARRCVAENCGRLEWSVLDWNEPSIKFYRSMGAKPLDAWTVQRVSGDDLTALAARPEPGNV
jgi:GNAT superfamily N-acetyltransferase